MGNAVITINHPAHLHHGGPILEGGKGTANTTTMIKLEKKEGAACGCGGRIQLRKHGFDGFSELYVYVDYLGANNGTIRWEKNDFELEFKQRWCPIEGSHMIIDISENDNNRENMPQANYKY